MRRRNSSSWGIFPIAGWLFTDLLLALALVFLVTSAAGVPIKPPPLPCLELQPQSIELTVDAQGLLNDNQTAVSNVQHQLLTFSKIQGRRAGLVLTYAGTPGHDASQVAQAKRVGDKVDNALALLGKSGFVFYDTVFHDTLHDFGEEYNKVLLEIYLFALPGQCPVQYITPIATP